MGRKAKPGGRCGGIKKQLSNKGVFCLWQQDGQLRGKEEPQTNKTFFILPTVCRSDGGGRLQNGFIPRSKPSTLYFNFNVNCKYIQKKVIYEVLKCAIGKWVSTQCFGRSFSGLAFQLFRQVTGENVRLCVGGLFIRTIMVTVLKVDSVRQCASSLKGITANLPGSVAK